MSRQPYRLANSFSCIVRSVTLVGSLLVAAAFAQNPVPQIVGPVKPTAVAPGSGPFTLTVYGANFVPGAVVNWNYQPRTTTFVSAHELQAQILSSDVTTNTAGTVTVTNPAPGGGNSSASFAQVEVHNPTTTIVPGYPHLAPMQFPYGDGGSIVLADFNGDNKLDLMYGGVATLGRGDGTFRFSQLLHNWSLLGRGMVYGDFNNDGKLDLAYVGGNAVNVRGEAIQVMLGDGTGKFNKAPRLIFNTTNTEFWWLAAGDINGDGQLDLVVMGVDTIYSYLGNGDGTFYKRVEYPFIGEGQGLSIQLGDFNNDGILDLLAVDAIGGLYVMLGNGDGTFQSAIQLAPSGFYGCQGFGQPLAIMDDFNGDGNLDVAGCYNIANISDVGVFLGNGDGTFGQPTYYTIPPGSFFSAIAGDFNSDGYTDLLFSNYSSASTYGIRLGNGDGTFQAAQQFTLPGKLEYTALSGLASGDVNADGLLDLIIIDAGGLDVISVQK
jgi:hypothetical protein